MIEGLFIAIEGVDGAGTTTHTRLLGQSLAGQGLPIHTTREPSDGPVGVLLRQMLTGRVVVPGISGSRPPSWPTMALLFAADRLDHVEAEIRPNLRDGVTVLTDRYDYSSVAYQSVSAGSDDETIEWVKNLNRHARRPDLTLVLDVDAEVAARRRTERSGGGGIYDDEELQKGLAKFYRDIEQHFPQDRIEHIDADRPIQEVAADVLQHVRTLRGD